MIAQVGLRGGSLYLDAATFDRFLSAREAVTLVRRDDDLYIIPLEDSALGGYLCKRRTAAGDRVVHAEDFFREQGLDATQDRTFDVAWREDVAALVITGAFGVYV